MQGDSIDVTEPGALFDVAGKTIVVTGGSRGIGFMIAEGFVRAGCNVYIIGRKPGSAQAAAQRLAGIGRCRAVPADLCTPEGVQRVVADVAAEQSIDVLVNNAGTAWGAPIDDFPRAGWDKVFNLNVRAAFELTAALLPLLRAAATVADPARIINVGSVEGTSPGESGNYPYTSSKAALHMLTRHLALKLAPESITANVLAPGPFETRMTEFIFEDEVQRQRLEANVPLARTGRPDDIAGAAIFLASRAGSFVTGAVVPVDGGLTIR